MPTVECDRNNCESHGREICIAKRVCWKDGKCLTFQEKIGKSFLDAPFNSGCHKQHGKYQSNGYRTFK